MKLIFIHGRNQQGKDSIFLKLVWKAAFIQGLKNAGLPSLENLNIEFPFYGDRLSNYVDYPNTIPNLLPQNATTRSANFNNIDAEEFAHDFWNEILQLKGLQTPSTRGIKDWWATQEILKLIDKYNTDYSINVIKKKTEDVHLYLTNDAVQQDINHFVRQSFTEEPCVVVGHSLGSVLGFILLKTYEQQLNVKKFITIGSPLGLEAIKQLLPFKPQMPSCVKHGWYNAYDDADFVALRGLEGNFPTDPSIVNNKKIKNLQEDPHDIVGYLEDKVIAKQIYDALLLPNL